MNTNAGGVSAHEREVRRPEPVRCDCLNHCGDDPWLKDGRAFKCQAHDRLHPPMCKHCNGTGEARNQ